MYTELICKFIFTNAKLCKFQSTDIRFVDISIYRSDMGWNDLLQVDVIITLCHALFMWSCFAHKALYYKVHLYCFLWIQNDYRNNNNAFVSLWLFQTAKGLWRDYMTIINLQKKILCFKKKKLDLYKCNQDKDTNQCEIPEDNMNRLMAYQWSVEWAGWIMRSRDIDRDYVLKRITSFIVEREFYNLQPDNCC